jgi:hypothetical protein
MKEETSTAGAQSEAGSVETGSGETGSMEAVATATAREAEPMVAVADRDLSGPAESIT